MLAFPCISDFRMNMSLGCDDYILSKSEEGNKQTLPFCIKKGENVSEESRLKTFVHEATCL